MAVTDVGALPVSLAAISKHLAVLAAAGLILQERRGGSSGASSTPGGCATPRSGCRVSGSSSRVDLDDFGAFPGQPTARLGRPAQE